MLRSTLSVLVLFLISSCAVPTLSPTNSPAATFTPTKTSLPSSITSDTPTPSATPTSTPKPTKTPTPTRDPNFIPEFVNTNYIELEKIGKISLFRSGAGHDSSDSFETCRSMKHYFNPHEHLDWSEVKIFAPVDGIVINVYEEWAGTQIDIRSNQYPNYTFTIFHVNLEPDIVVGLEVTEGMKLGTHVGNFTSSDIAVTYRTNPSASDFRAISIFDVMTDELFAQYQMRGAQKRTDFIISRALRDENPLICDGQTFINQSSLPNWFILN